MRFLNQYSFLLAALAIGLVLIVVLWRWHRAKPLLRIALLAWYGLGVLVVSLVWRYSATSDITTTAQVNALLNAGRPTFVMLYSNY
jgi:drug/metabolite transporter (DMT)-like permease